MSEYRPYWSTSYHTDKISDHKLKKIIEHLNSTNGKGKASKSSVIREMIDEKFSALGLEVDKAVLF